MKTFVFTDEMIFTISRSVKQNPQMKAIHKKKKSLETNQKHVRHLCL